MDLCISVLISIYLSVHRIYHPLAFNWSLCFLCNYMCDTIYSVYVWQGHGVGYGHCSSVHGSVYATIDVTTGRVPYVASPRRVEAVSFTRARRFCASTDARIGVCNTFHSWFLITLYKAVNV